MSNKLKISVLGAGSWGLTLALLLAENEHTVTLWECFPEYAEEIRNKRESSRFLPGIHIPDPIAIETDIAAAIGGADFLLFAVPSHAVREVAAMVAKNLDFSEKTCVVNAAKGLEEGTLKRMSEVLSDELPVGSGQILTLSGPSHAEEVSRHMPTSVVIAGTDEDRARYVQGVFVRPYFRLYTNSDIVGVETAVALKNVIAIAAGVCDGLGYGDNTKAALVTRGLVEITGLGMALGARRETFFGLAGIGDLVVTCLSRHSRNRHVGEEIGRGMSLDEVLAGMVMVAEGVRTTRAAIDLSAKLGVEMPITDAVHQVLFRGGDPREGINKLMSRPPQDEMKRLDTASKKGGR